MEFRLELLPIPVTDIDRAKQFYAEKLGFNVDVDTQIGPGKRLVQLTPNGSGCSIAIGDGIVETPPGSVRGVQLIVADIAAARAALADNGVDISNVQHFEDGAFVDGPGGTWNSFVFFDDPDGNGWLLQERPAT